MMNRRRVVLLGGIVACAIIAWLLWIRSDAYQRRAAFDTGAELVKKHPALPPAAIADWFAAAAVYDRKRAVQALQAIPSGAAREQSVSAMARSLLKAGHTVDALAVAGEISDTGTLATLLKDLAASLVSSPDKPVARLDEELKALADRERPPALSATVLSSLATGLAAVGANHAATVVAHQYPDPGEQTAALLSLSQRFNDAGANADAVSCRREALSAAMQIPAPRPRLAMLMQLLVAFYEAGELTLAKSALTAAGSAAAALPDAGSRVEFLPVFSQALERTGDQPAAQTAMMQAIASVRALPAPEDRSKGYTRIAGLSRDPAAIDVVAREAAALPADLASAPTCAAARSIAGLGELRRARTLAGKCALPIDQLSVFAAILRANAR